LAAAANAGYKVQGEKRIMSTDELKRAAKEATDENGQPIVQIPLDVWQRFLEDEPDVKDTRSPQEILADETLPQHIRINAALEILEDIPDDKSEEWWDEFEQFLRENRMSFPERDLDWGLDEE
jgi:hypothetical protein